MPNLLWVVVPLTKSTYIPTNMDITIMVLLGICPSNRPFKWKQPRDIQESCMYYILCVITNDIGKRNSENALPPVFSQTLPDCAKDLRLT